VKGQKPPRKLDEPVGQFQHRRRVLLRYQICRLLFVIFVAAFALRKESRVIAGQLI